MRKTDDIWETEDPARLIDEFKQKLTRVVEKERKKLAEEAKQESAAVISSAREEAARIITKAREQAEREAEQKSVQIIDREPGKKLRMNQPAIWLR